ncbi:MAG: TraR/DksA family transcriptional regulator [Planctomycetota bacterium]|nr:TraR/DksA family transcriptional regulator [Planctomycetota bacterium]
MKKIEMRPYKKMLILLRARLQGDVNALADAALGSSAEAQGELSSLPSHMADLGSDTFEQDNTLRLMDNEELVLEQIEQALERIEEGSYGTCIDCGSRIPKMRLNVIPYTPLCVKCASNLESDDPWN